NYESILTHESLRRWVEVLKKAPAFAFDTETDSLNNIDARLIGLSFAVEPGKAAYIPLRHDYLDAPEQLPVDEVLTALKPI
ncbi:hypothetical protein, partial [Escherichia coli]|uniref:hypothetical protein n=1 Tax=Escherichia coli TaxID=562 RepID=UPI003CE6C405